MKWFICILICFYINISYTQNVGIGETNPKAKLDVKGGIKVGQSTGSEEGTIQYNGNEFQGRQNGQWEALGVPESGIVLSSEYINNNLKNSGFDFYGEFQIPLVSYPQSNVPGTFAADQWNHVYYKGDVEKTSHLFSRSNYIWRDSVLLAYNGYGQFDFYSVKENTWNSFIATVPNAYNTRRGTLHSIGNTIFFITGVRDAAGFKMNLADTSIIELPNMNVSYFFKGGYHSELINNKIILYGGFDDNVVSNTGVIYDISSSIWSNMNMTNSPPALYDFESCGLLQEFCVFGGKSFSNTYINFSDVGKFYNVNTNLWSDMSSTGSSPKGRIGHTMTAINSDFFFLYGGMVDQSGVTKDTSDGWVYHYQSGWSSSIDLPGESRGDHTAVADLQGNIIVYGGANQFYAPSGFQKTAKVDGFIVNPITGMKTSISECNLTSARRFDAQSIWTGNQLFIMTGSCVYSAFGLYTPKNTFGRFCEENQILLYNYEDLSFPKPIFYTTLFRDSDIYLYRKE